VVLETVTIILQELAASILREEVLMETVCSYEIYVMISNTMQYQNPENNNLKLKLVPQHCYGNTITSFVICWYKFGNVCLQSGN